MSIYKRSLQAQHERIARGIDFLGPAEPSATGDAGGPPGGGPTGDPNQQPTKSSSPPAKPPPSSTTTTTTTSKDTQPTKKPDDPATKQTTTTTTTPSTSSTPSSSSSTSTLPTSTISIDTSLPTNFVTTPVVYPTDNYNTDLPTTTDGDVPTVSSSADASNNNSSSSGALNTGAIIGGIAGGLGGIALLGIIISFFLRRYRNRRRAEEFDAAQFRSSAMIMDGDDARPASLFGGRWGGFASSVRNSFGGAGAGAGMAGRGAFTEKEDVHNQADMHYSDYNQSGHTPTSATGLQPRQQYTYGDNYDQAAARDDDHTHGPYSEQPHQQDVYNLEAYGHYEAYTTDDNNGVQYPAAAHHAHHGKEESDPYGGI